MLDGIDGVAAVGGRRRPAEPLREVPALPTRVDALREHLFSVAGAVMPAGLRSAGRGAASAEQQQQQHNDKYGRRRRGPARPHRLAPGPRNHGCTQDGRWRSEVQGYGGGSGGYRKSGFP